MRRLLGGGLVAMLLASCGLATAATLPADLILQNGKIYTVDGKRPWASAIAIRDGKIVAVGDAAAMKPFRSDSSRIENLDGRTVLPGIVDGHVHVLWAAQNAKNYTCHFSIHDDLDAVLVAVRKCAMKAPADGWIVGEYWSSALISEVSTKEALKRLDDAAGGRPVYLRDDTTHNRWASSRAMELAGITAATPDPAGGHIVKDPASGVPTGLFVERPAFLLVEKVTPFAVAVPPQAIQSYVADSIARLNSFGVTAFLDARIENEEVREAFTSLDEAGRLTAHVGLATLFDASSAAGAVDRMKSVLSRNATPHIDSRFVKIYLDGVMTTRTAVFIEPYLPGADGDGHFHGSKKIDDESLGQFVTAMDRLGVTVKFHAAGDGAVRQALDAVEAARRANGASGPIHQVAHAGYVSSDDIARFAALHVAVDASPTVWFPGSIEEQTAANIGKDRANHYWPFKSMLASKVIVAGGTDWKTLPDEYSSLWDGIEAMITRRNPSGRVAGEMWLEQALTLAQAIEAYTLGSAKASRLDDRVGSITAGKSADLIVLDRDIFSQPPEAISETKVLRTIFEGKTVYEAARP